MKKTDSIMAKMAENGKSTTKNVKKIRKVKKNA